MKSRTSEALAALATLTLAFGMGLMVGLGWVV